MSVESFLSTVGKDFKKFVGFAIPIETTVVTAAPAFGPVGSVISLVGNVVIQTEQKWAAIGQQSGTGTQKLAEATQIVAPAITSILGPGTTSTTITTIVNAVVAMLNAMPASMATTALAATTTTAT